MTWTYTNAPATVPRDAVRFLSGDTDTGNQQVTDEAIAFLLTEWNDNTYLAAAAVCDAAAGKAAAQADESKSVGDLSISTQHAAQARSWEARGASLRAQDARRHPPSPTFSSRSVGSFAFRVGMDTYQTDSQYGITPE